MKAWLAVLGVIAASGTGCDLVLGLGDLEPRGADSGPGFDGTTGDAPSGGGDGATDGGTGADGTGDAPSTDATVSDGTATDGAPPDGGGTDGGVDVDAAPLLYVTPQRVAVDSRYVYWTDNGTYVYGLGEKNYDGKVMRAPLDGGAPEAVATGQYGPYGIVVTPTAVYWTDNWGQSGDIMVVPLDDGGIAGLPATVVAMGSGLPDDQGLFLPQLLTVAQGVVYWTDSFVGVVSQPLSGGAATLVYASSGTAYQLLDITSDSNNVYFTYQTVVMAAPLDGGAAFQVAAAGNAEAIAVDSTNLYYSDQGSVLTIPLADLGTAAPTPIVVGLNSPWAIAVDPARGIYWTENGPSGTVGTAALDGGNVQTLASQQLFPWGLALTPTAVWWANQGNCPEDDGGCIPGSVQSQSR